MISTAILAFFSGFLLGGAGILRAIGAPWVRLVVLGISYGLLALALIFGVAA